MCHEVEAESEPENKAAKAALPRPVPPPALPSSLLAPPAKGTTLFPYDSAALEKINMPGAVITDMDLCCPRL
jgi:hypothetical protein